jgi:hypothetical protein
MYADHAYIKDQVENERKMPILQSVSLYSETKFTEFSPRQNNRPLHLYSHSIHCLCHAWKDAQNHIRKSLFVLSSHQTEGIEVLPIKLRLQVSTLELDFSKKEALYWHCYVVRLTDTTALQNTLMRPEAWYLF